MFSQVCVIPSVHGGRVPASGSGCVCTPPGHPPGDNGQQAGVCHPTGMLSY